MQEILTARARGETFAFIGGKLGITKQRAHQLVRATSATPNFAKPRLPDEAYIAQLESGVNHGFALARGYIKAKHPTQAKLILKSMVEWLKDSLIE